MNKTGSQDTILVITRAYDAPRARVFRAFTDPAELMKWYAPVEGWIVSAASVDLRAGGGFHLEFGPPGGDPIIEDAEYIEVVPDERLVYRLGLRGRTTSEDTHVTITFADAGGGTEIVITETGYSSQEIRDMHIGGLSFMLDRLATVV